MSRNLTQAVKDALAAVGVYPAVFVEVNVASGPVRVWSGIGDKAWSGYTWSGVGSFGGVSPIGETTEVRAEGIRLILSGIPANMLGYALSEIRQGKTATIWLACLDSAGAVIADPYASFSGRVDACDVEEGGDTSTIQISVESELIDLQRSRERRYTYEDQQIDFPGDKGFEYVAALQEMNLVWGKGDPIPVKPDRHNPGGRGSDYPRGPRMRPY